MNIKKTNNKMKILMLNYEFPPLGGGGGVASYKLAKGFVKLGHQVDVVTTWFKGLKEIGEIEGITVYRVKVPMRTKLQTASLISMLFFPRRAYRLAKNLIEKNKYDLINTHFAIPTGPVGVKLSKKYGIKNILSIHGGDIYDPTKKLSPHNNFILRWIVRNVLNNSDYVVAQSSNTKENTIKYYSPKNRIDVIPLAYEPFSFNKVSRKSLNLSKNKKYLIGIGRLVKRKGFDFAIKALSRLPKNIELLIIGDGPEKQNLKNLANKLSVAQRVRFLGQLSQEKKFQYLNNSDIFFLSSVHEGFGIVLQEAMQVGLPIISTNNGGQTDIIKDGKNGFLVNYGDTEEAKDKIKSLLNKKRAKKNKEQIGKFNLKDIAKRYLELI
ncbi:MAG: glycosyltransferase family 4 protein [Nanoarchaeota archaeon]